MSWPRITLTGIDSMTPRIWIGAMVKAYPDIEFGVLHSASNQANRYTQECDLMDRLTPCVRQAALHVCGREAVGRLLTRDKFRRATEQCQRMQVNGTHACGVIEAICRKFPNHQIITQWKPDTIYCDEENPLEVIAKNHAILVDGSGGRGVCPAVWVRPDTKKEVGFAGGLRLENFEVEFRRIEKVAKGRWWVDLETGLRNAEDYFDPVVAKSIADLFEDIATRTDIP